MRHSWPRYLRLILAGIAGTTVIGLYFGYPLQGLLAGLSAYLWWTLIQARRLYLWLDHPDADADAPESLGLWGDLFDRLNKLHRGHRQRQQQLLATLDRIQESTNAMRDGVIMTDARGTMEWWNDAAERLLGFRRHSDQGQYIHNLIRTPAFKAYFDSRDYQEPLAIHAPAKPHIHLQVQISLFGEDDRLIVARDMTRIHQLELMRRDFVGNVSHEMRTPLTVIRGYLETLLEHSGELPKKWHRPLQAMTTQSNRMEALITDLILLSRIETGNATPDHSPINVPVLMEQICADARALSGDAQHQIRFTASTAHGVMGDESQLRSAFSNLVFNAVKYTPPGGVITVDWCESIEGAWLSVCDSGIGIDPVHIPRLTERFYRADPSRHKDTGGTGLGLAIVKHALLNHDATLAIHSQPGEGSEFICQFPEERLTKPQ